MTTTKVDAIVLDCGHPPSEHSEFTTGYGINPDGKKHCYDCCHAIDREEMKTATSFMAYLTKAPTPENPNRLQITNWPGRVLAKAVGWNSYKAWGFGGWYTRYTFHATDLDGRRWYGTSPGPGMYCRMRPFKNQPKK